MRVRILQSVATVRGAGWRRGQVVVLDDDLAAELILGGIAVRESTPLEAALVALTEAGLDIHAGPDVSPEVMKEISDLAKTMKIRIHKGKKSSGRESD